MQFFPKKKGEKQKLSKFILLFLLFLLVYLVLRFIINKQIPALKSSTPSPLSNTPLVLEKEQMPPCPQQIDASGYKVENGKVLVSPRCLTVMNSRLGSRFNLDWYFGKQEVKSSVLGNLQDQPTNFNLQIKDKNKITQVWPLNYNSPSPKTWVDLGPNHQTIYFQLDDVLLSLKIHSPFAPSESTKDENLKISSSPFFYLTLTIENQSQNSINKDINISLGNFKESGKANKLQTIYYSDPSSPEGLRALSTQNPELELFAYKKSGGFKWQLNLNPNENKSIDLVYAGYTQETAITNTIANSIERNKFAYTKWFDDINKVINYAFKNQNKILKLSHDFEKSFNSSDLSPQEKWLAVQAFHSYIANSWLVYNKDKNNFEYYVWEGEFKYLNTLDVAHDYGVLPGLYFPWALKLELDSWQTAAKEDDFGVVIPHDLGKRFNAIGTQDYKIPGWETSGMPVEENANFILLAYWYWQQSGDNEYLKKTAPFIKSLIESLINRDTNNNGIVDTGIGMTTYDSDANLALKGSPDSTYLAVKQLSAYLCANKIFKEINNIEGLEQTDKQSQLITDSLKNAYQDYKHIPLSLDPNFVEKEMLNNKAVKGIEEQGMVYISGLFYPSLTKLQSPYLDEIIPILKASYPTAYEKSLLKKQDGKTLGLQLTEYNNLNLGWFSHSIMADYISKQLLDQEYKSWEIFWPHIYDNPYGFTDGFYFREPYYPIQSCLLFYPRGVTIFAFIK